MKPQPFCASWKIRRAKLLFGWWERWVVLSSCTATLWGQGMHPTEQGLETGGSQALGLLIRAWTHSMGSCYSLQCSTEGCSAKGLARNPALGLRVIAQKSFTELMCFYEKKKKNLLDE